MRKIQVLEGARGLAALYVFLAHLFSGRLEAKASQIGLLFRFGQEAVMLFFLLSGFVIYVSWQRKPNQTAGDYFLRRFKRIYPIFLLSCLITYLSASFSAGEFVSLNIPHTLGNLFMLQDFQGGKPGVWFPPFLGNLALWSLSYEWWFYMLFLPIVRLESIATQRSIVAGLSLGGTALYYAIPNQICLFAMYFAIWWAGLELARTYCSSVKIRPSNQRVMIGLLGGIMVLQLAVVIWTWSRHLPMSFGLHPILELRHFTAAVVLLLGAVCFSTKLWLIVGAVVKPFAILAPISYALYVLHLPLAVRSSYLFFLPGVALQCLGYIAITILVSLFAEGPYQRLTNTLIDRVAATVRSSGRNLNQEQAAPNL